MRLIEITDLNIPSLQIYRQMRDNAVTKDNSFIADSPKVVSILLETDIEVRLLYVADKTILKKVFKNLGKKK